MHPNDRKPNFRTKTGRLYLVRCFSCGGDHGRENWAVAVASGQCAWCGWSEESAEQKQTDDSLPATQKRTDDNLRSIFGG